MGWGRFQGEPEEGRSRKRVKMKACLLPMVQIFQRAQRKGCIALKWNIAGVELKGRGIRDQD